MLESLYVLIVFIYVEVVILVIYYFETPLHIFQSNTLVVLCLHYPCVCCSYSGKNIKSLSMESDTDTNESEV